MSGQTPRESLENYLQTAEINELDIYRTTGSGPEVVTFDDAMLEVIEGEAISRNAALSAEEVENTLRIVRTAANVLLSSNAVHAVYSSEDNGGELLIVGLRPGIPKHFASGVVWQKLKQPKPEKAQQ